MTSDGPAEHELPDDVDRWPADPHQLLGVASDVSRRDLKRSYTRLIRRFKPEHFPDQFRRLREAFDQIDRQLEFFEQYQVQVNVDKDATSQPALSTDHDGSPSSNDEHSHVFNKTTSPNDDAGGTRSASSEPVRNEHRVHTNQSRDSNDSDQLWQQVLDGNDPTTAYSQFVRIVAQGRGKDTDFARLYWLLSIRPELNPEKHPCQWLIEGIRLHGCRNQLPHMLSADIRRNPERVPSMLSMELFDSMLSVTDIVGLAELRWLVSRHLSQVDMIEADLQRLEPRFFEAPDEWQRLLFFAIRQLVFVPSPPALILLKAVSKKLGQTPATVASNWLWDSFDSMMALHNIWIRRGQDGLIGNVVTLRGIELSGQPKSIDVNQTSRARITLGMLLNLIGKTWECSPLQARSEVLSACAQLTNYPLTSLNELALITQVARPVVYRFLELLREQKDIFVDQESYKLTPAAQRRLFEFVLRDLWQFESWEASVVNFCLHEAVTANDVAEVIEACHSRLPESSLTIAQAIRNDLAIVCIVEAQRLLW